MWTWMIDNGYVINLGISAGFFLISIAIYFTAKREVLKLSCANWAYVIWTAQWLILTTIYLLKIKYPQNEILLLGFSDLQSISVIATAWAFIKGNDFKPTNLIVFTLLFAIFLELWNIGLYPQDGNEPAVWQRILWFSPSVTVSSLALPLLGFSFFIRYKVYGSPFLIVSILYSWMQIAAYVGIYIPGAVVQSVMMIYPTLALGKLLLGISFYTLFFVKLPDYPSAVPQLTPQVDQVIWNQLKKATLRIITTIIMPLVGAVIASLVGRSFLGR